MNFQALRTTLNSDRYIGIPYCANGCYWLLREVYRCELGVELPEDNLMVVEDSWGSAIQGARPEWVEVKEPQTYDVVLMFSRRGDSVPAHLGVYTGDGRVLHTRRKTGSILESLEALQRTGLVEGFYRHKGV